MVEKIDFNDGKNFELLLKRKQGKLSKEWSK
jgi:hypothetical protein